MTAYIGTHNYFEEGTLTASSEATGYEKENAFNWNTFDYWKPTGNSGDITVDSGVAGGVDPDYLAIGFHNLSSAGHTLRLRRSSDGITYSLAYTYNPTTDGVIFLPISVVPNRYYRLSVSGGSEPPVVGMFSLGQSLTLPYGMQAPFITPTYGRNKKIMNSITQGGQFVGRTVQNTGQKFEIAQKGVSETWIESNWTDLVDHIEIKPFFFLWDQENHPAEAIYAWANKFRYPSYTQPYYSFSISCEGLLS